MNFGWVSGVLPFRDKETGLKLDLDVGGIPGKTVHSGYSSLVFSELWCCVIRVDHSTGNLENTVLRNVFEHAKLKFEDYVHRPLTVPTTPGIELLVAKVTFKPTKFLDREGFAAQVEIS